MSLCPIFYCSRCKIDHAGECPPEVLDPGRALRYKLPLNSLWATEHWVGGKWERQPGRGPYKIVATHHGGEYALILPEGAETGVVKDMQIPAVAWEPEGTMGNGNIRYRMVAI